MDDVLTRARAALASGDYSAAMDLTRDHRENAQALALHLRALAGIETPAVMKGEAARAVQSHPLSVEIHFMHALVLMDGGRDRDAMSALQRVLYLDRSLAVAHFLLGALHARLDDKPAARRAWRNAFELSGKLPRDTVLPLSQNERAGALHDAVRARLAGLDDGGPA